MRYKNYYFLETGAGKVLDSYAVGMISNRPVIEGNRTPSKITKDGIVYDELRDELYIPETHELFNADLYIHTINNRAFTLSLQTIIRAQIYFAEELTKQLK